jgi:general secretion pathway protein B
VPVPGPATASAAATANPTLVTPAPATTGAMPPPPPRAPEPGRNPLAEEVGEAPPGVDPSLAAAAASVPQGPPAVTRQRGSVVYAPIPEASDPPYTPPPAAAPAVSAAPATEVLPSADEMAARGVPPLHLDLHVYSNAPQQRFVFVNSRKYREGEALQEGPVVEQITQDGAVLSFRGSRFKLSHD